MLLFTEEKTRHETMIRKQFIKINRHGKVSLNGKRIFEFCDEKRDFEMRAENSSRNVCRPSKQAFIM